MNKWERRAQKRKLRANGRPVHSMIVVGKSALLNLPRVNAAVTNKATFKRKGKRK